MEKYAVAVSEKLVKIDSLVKENKELDERCENLRGLCERLLDHITENAVYDADKEQAKFRAFWKKRGEIKDEKSRVHDNK